MKRNYKPFMLLLPMELRQRLEEKSKLMNISLNAYIRMVLSEYIAKQLE